MHLCCCLGLALALIASQAAAISRMKHSSHLPCLTSAWAAWPVSAVSEYPPQLSLQLERRLRFSRSLGQGGNTLGSPAGHALPQRLLQPSMGCWAC